MAAIASPWGKPGAWALDSEENEAELLQQQPNPSADASVAEFPSLSAAAATKVSKKKTKPQKMSLADLKTYSAPNSRKTDDSRGLTHEDLLLLPKGPRERTAEELDRDRLGGGFRSYGGGRYGDEGNNRRGGFDESRTREPLPPSRADETDDWGAAKKSLGAPPGNGFDRRERSSGFFNSNSKADESDNWGSNKSMDTRRFSSNNSSSEFGRERRGFGAGFEGMSNGAGADSDRWGRRPQDEGRADPDKWSRRVQGEGGADTDNNWGRKPQEEGILGNSSRPKLVLQPRTLPVPVSEGSGGSSPVGKPKGSSPFGDARPKASNPFGDARPREEVLKEKGQDWKEIDEKLEAVKIKEEKGEGTFGKRGFGNGNGRMSPTEHDGKTERSWRKNDAESAEAVPSAENVEEAVEEVGDDNSKAEA